MNHNNTEAASGLEFFKVFLPDSSSQHMIIPRSFVKDLIGTFPKKTTIKDHIGKSWRVTLEKRNDVVFFKKGWAAFVDYHFLSYGDFLVFQYDGHCIFNVKIFGKNGRLKAAVAHSLPTKEDAVDNVEDNVVAEVAHSPPIVEEDMVAGAHSPPIVEDDMVAGAHSVLIVEDDVVAEAHSVLIVEDDVVVEATNSFSIVKAVVDSVPILEVKEEEPVVQKEDVRPLISNKRKRLQVGSKIVRKRRNIAAPNRGRSRNASNSVEHVGPRGPCFERTMKRWSNKRIYIPGSVVRDQNISLKPNIVFRDEEGKLWPATICSTSQNRIFVSGWSKFYQGYKLRVNDKCEFEFVLERGNVCRQLNVKVTRRRCLAAR